MPPHIRPARHWIVGDVHGCAESLARLLRLLPCDDRVVLCGDLINRGPQIQRCMELAWQLVRSGRAVWLKGNHEADLVSELGRERSPGGRAAGESDTVLQLGGSLCRLWRRRLEGLPCVYGGRGWVATHAGFDPSTWQPDLRVRAGFWSAYDGRFGRVVVGHTPMPEVITRRQIVMVDTGACYGGKLSAYCPETGAVVQVPGQQPPLPPALPPAMRAQLEAIQGRPRLQRCRG